jgi:hypothetical protein
MAVFLKRINALYKKFCKTTCLEQIERQKEFFILKNAAVSMRLVVG